MVPTNNFLKEGMVPANNFLKAGTVPANNHILIIFPNFVNYTIERVKICMESIESQTNIEKIKFNFNKSSKSNSWAMNKLRISPNE